MRTASSLLCTLLLATTAATAGEGNDPARTFRDFLDAEWERSLRENPTWASSLGDRRWNDLWPDLSKEAHAKRDADDRAALERLLSIPRSRLSEADRISHDLYRQQLQDSIEERGYRVHLMPVDHMGGIQNAHQIAESLRFLTVRDYEDWIGRIRRLPTYVDQTIALMREGIAAGIVAPRILMERVPAQIAHQIVDDPEESPYYAPLRRVPDSVGQDDRERLRAEAAREIRRHVIPAYRRLARFFERDYLPATREAPGASALPDGEAFYAFRVRHYTTTSITPREVHETGLREVARIRARMQAIVEEVGFDGDLAAFLQYLRTDPRFFAADPDALLERYRATAKRIDPELVKLFGTIPRMPYGVKPIPDDIAPDTTTAYYNPPAADGSRAGTYYVNLYRPEVRPLWEIEALSIHEAVPGHHFQIALAMELEDLPEFRRNGGITAFVEGWALYAESLGKDLGLYEDPYSRFGQLTYEMWRAVRLVVDTGIHALGWPREKAIEYFKANAAKTEHDIVNEIDRYIAWPGQALAYKIGELKIKELRARATEALGDDFDIRAFHDVVLRHGAVPLDVLEAQVDSWIAKEKKP